MHKSVLIAAMTAVIATAAVAQTGPKSGLKPVLTHTSGQPATAAGRISQASDPTFDEGTIQRIAGALLSYSALELQGGWPALPPGSSKLAPGTSGADVALLRRRLAITDDLPAALADGDVYDAALAAAIRRFQARHGLAETGSLGGCASLPPRSIVSPPWISISANATSW